MKTWQDLKDNFKNSYRITKALEEAEKAGLVNTKETAETLSDLLSVAMVDMWATDDIVFWSTLWESLKYWELIDRPAD